jgi:predicted porin
MPLALGEKQFLNNERFGDDAILLWVDPNKELHLAGIIAKLNEGSIDVHRDDLDGYVLLATYALDKDNTVGINWTYVDSDDVCPSLGDVEDLAFHNIGIHGNGNISGIMWAAEADMQFGGVDDVAVLGGEDRDAEGWAVLAKLGYMVDPVNLRAKFAYGSGDDNFFDADCEEFQTIQGPDDILAISRFVHHTMIYERWVSTAAVESLLTTHSGCNSRNTGIANTTLFNLGMDFNATPNLNLAVDGFYLQASETGAWEDIVGATVEDDLGWELDFKGTYKIAKNLSYFVEAAGFWPGDFYQDVFGVDETVTHVLHGLVLHF